MIRILLGLFVGCLVVLVTAMLVLPWWGFLLVLIAVFGFLLLAVRWLSARIAQSLFATPFRAKGAALRHAKLEVVEISPAPTPRSEPTDGTDDTIERAYYWVDVTISPVPNPGPFKLWEAGELRLLPASVRKVGLDETPPGPLIASIEIFENGRFRPDEGLKYFGPQRLRLCVGLSESDERQQSFLYYFEKFGLVTFPLAETRREGK